MASAKCGSASPRAAFTKAIKFVYGNLNALDGDDARALQEMKALERVKQVRHPFVLSIEQIQNVGGELLIVMELADKNLHEVPHRVPADRPAGHPARCSSRLPSTTPPRVSTT